MRTVAVFLRASAFVIVYSALIVSVFAYLAVQP
jgi:hypothetical protein